MYYDNTLNKIKKVGLVFSLILGFIIISGPSVNAQRREDRNWRNNDSYNRNYTYDANRVAQETGYRDGFKDGADAVRESDKFHPQNSGDWQKGTNGYESRYGSKSAYKSAYRSAYVEGYKAAFDKYNNYSRSAYRRNY